MDSEKSNFSAAGVNLPATVFEKRLNFTFQCIVVLIAMATTCYLATGEPVFIPIVAFVGILVLVLNWAVRTPVFGFDCPFCKKGLSTGEAWVCGYCDNLNVSVRFWGFQSLVAGCGRNTCGKRPKAFQCYHCNHIMFLDGDLDGRHPATAMGKPRPPLIVEPPSEFGHDEAYKKRREKVEVEKQKQQLESELIQEEIGLAELHRKVMEQRKLLERLTSHDFWEDEDDKIPPRDSVEFVRRKEKHTRRWAAVEERITNDSTLDKKLKESLIDSGRRFLHAKLNAMKPK